MVSIMKTLRDPQDLPLFEPKMTRSRLKTVQQGKPPQFVDIDLEEDEDSSDEEYCPDEDEETLFSPPRMHLASQHNAPLKQKTQSDLQGRSLSEKWSFMEKLDAVESEMDRSLNYEQPGDRRSEGDDDDDEGCLALRTRSRLHLEDVPLGQLEAELVSDDITDVCEGTFDQEDDRQWMLWLQSLLHPDCQDELDEEDDPEYDFVEDLTEPDLEDYRTDRGVQITRREVNKLLEELFDTLQEEEEEEEEEADESHPQVLQSEVLLDQILTEPQRTDQKQNKCPQQRRVLQDTTNHLHTTAHDLSPVSEPSLKLNHNQKLQLKQQIQQHVQLLTEVHLLSRDIPALSLQARITKHHLEDLHQRASVSSSLSVCNLKASLDLLQEVDGHDQPAAASHSHRLLPTMAASTNSLAFPLLPAHTAWLFATRPEFLYTELLPVCSLNPEYHQRPRRSVFTAGEEGLTVLGLKHFLGSVQPEELMCSFLLCQSVSAVRKRIRERIGPKAEPENILKRFLMEDVTPPLPLACSRVQSDDQRPPVDRNSPNMPTWLQNSQQIIRKTRSASLHYPSQLPPGCSLRLHPYWLKRSVRYRPRPHKQIFPLAHNDCLLPLAKASAGNQPISSQPLAPLTVCPAIPLATVSPDCSPFICGDIIQSPLPIGSNLLSQNFSNLLMPCSVAPPAYLLLQVTVTPPTPCNTQSPGCWASEGGRGEGGSSEGGGGERGASESSRRHRGASEEGGGEGGASEGGGGKGGASEGEGGARRWR
ncbi:GON-4-like protein [Gouania willdenowi]|uniref:GON-4-like protein n=1 Tax=Gouania willdenowi TaxID=441366 RepID=UPI001056478C|nr:GON-4-like protein [Gouania willdenowi]